MSKLSVETLNIKQKNVRAELSSVTMELEKNPSDEKSASALMVQKMELERQLSATEEQLQLIEQKDRLQAVWDSTQTKLNSLSTELDNESLDEKYAAALYDYKTRIENQTSLLTTRLEFITNEIAIKEEAINNADIDYTSEQQEIIDYIIVTFPDVYTSFLISVREKNVEARQEFFTLFSHAKTVDTQALLLNSLAGIY